MSQTTITPALGCNVISLPKRPAESSCSSLDVLETMVDIYFRAMQAQLAEVRAEASTKEQ